MMSDLHWGGGLLGRFGGLLFKLNIARLRAAELAHAAPAKLHF